MKTKNKFKNIIVAIVFLSTAIISCKKEKQQPPAKKTHIVLYKAIITGPTVSATMSFYNPEQKQTVTETMVISEQIRSFSFDEGSYATITVNTAAQNIATAEIYIDGIKRYSNSSTSMAYVDCIIN